MAINTGAHVKWESQPFRTVFIVLTVGSNPISFYAIMHIGFTFLCIPTVICHLYCRFHHMFRYFSL